MNCYDRGIALKTKYPDLFTPRSQLNILPGWATIIERVCDLVSAHQAAQNQRRQMLLKNNPWNTPIPDQLNVSIIQIKEKFGGLQIYCNGADLWIEGVISFATTWSYHTCQDCGKEGELREDLGWIRTLCDTDYQERLQK